ncbi:MAG: homoaconitate hydratase, partial [Candidatus Humimicrobiaceae bacterium]
MNADNINKNINIIDSTLRSGEQTAGVVFSKNEKIRIARILDEIGVPELEVGVPSIAEAERETIKAILGLNLNCRIFGYCEADPKEIEYAVDCG